jgi:glycosyltransferase involved in cell wall biosynthesis
VFSSEAGRALSGPIPASMPTGTVNLSRGLARLPGVEVHHLCPMQSIPRDTVVEEEGVIVHCLRIPRRVTAMSALQYPKWRFQSRLRAIQPDIVHGHHAEAGFPYFAVSSHLPAIAGIHNWLPSLNTCAPKRLLSTTLLFRWFEAYTVRRAKTITVDSAFIEALIRPHTAATIHRIPNCVHESFFRRGVPSESSYPTVTFVGQIRPEKGLALLIEAISRLRRSGLDVSLNVVGRLSHDRSEHVMASIEKEGLKHAVRFLGWLDLSRMQTVMSESWAIAVPSLWEPFGCVAVEAMALGKAVVASAVGGLKENIDHERCGLLFDPRSARALENELRRVLTDASLRGRLGEAAARKAVNLWHPDIIAKRHLALYQDSVTLEAGP